MSIPYMPLYVSDYEADTAHLSLEEDGCYMRLLRLCWRTPGCSIPDDPTWIMRRLRIDRETFERVCIPVIEEFFQVEKARLFSPRLRKEHDRISDTSRKRSDAGKLGGRPRKALNEKQNDKSPAKANGKHLELDIDIDKRDTNVSLARVVLDCDRFQDFWDQYPHRGGAKKGKASARKAWDRAVKARASPDQIIAGAMRYASDRQVIAGYAKDPATWINAKGWEDEIERAGPRIAVSEGRPHRADPALEQIARLAGLGQA
jgi:uncharacterized protein YdaU (DUF1376 family)